MGIIRARYRNGFAKTELLAPDKVEKYHIDLGHIAHSFEPGHCIRVEISNSAAPTYNSNQNTGNPVATDRARVPPFDIGLNVRDVGLKERSESIDETSELRFGLYRHCRRPAAAGRGFPRDWASLHAYGLPGRP